MSSDQSVADIFFYIAQKHPELLGGLPSPDDTFTDFVEQLGFRGTFYYRKDTSCELASLCDKYGSDKGEIRSTGHPYPWPSHSYSDYYSRLWGHCRKSVTKVFECGLGTNNPDLPSSMGVSGQPGASLRVWRDYFPNAMVIGADIDKDVLFSEDRIQTYYVDQLNPTAIAELWSNIDDTDFDFMVDDGLHVFEAGSCLFTHSIERLAPHGIYVIEDVNQADLRKYRDFFTDKSFLVDFISLHRPNLDLGDNNLVVVRKRCDTSQ